MKKKILKTSLCIGIPLIIIIGFVFFIFKPHLSKDVKRTCKYTIKEIELYLDRKIDMEEMQKNIEEYAEECKKYEEKDNFDDSLMCIKLSSIGTSAFFKNLSNKNGYTELEDDLKSLKKECW